MPQVSVVIPTKGRPTLLRRAIDSVLCQTLEDLELIVVVDGPDPETQTMLSTIADPRLVVLVNARSLGGNLTRNAGADAAHAAWLAFLDDDDEWLPEKLARQLAFAQEATARGKGRFVLSCLSLVITPYGEGIRPRHIYQPPEPLDQWLFDRRSLLGGRSFFQTSSIFIETALFHKIRFRSPQQHDEWDLLLRARRDLGVTLLTVPEVLVRHYMDQNRASLTNQHRIEQSLKWLEFEPGLISKRAYSGFCLTVVGQHAARQHEWPLFWILLRSAFAKGRPTALQLAVFFSVWLFPRGIRRRLSFRMAQRPIEAPSARPNSL